MSVSLSRPPTDAEMEALFNACAQMNLWAVQDRRPIFHWRTWAWENMDRLVACRRAYEAGFYQS